jgi:hypothetical protein
MKTALYTTFYRAAARYFAPWFESVRAQSDQDFDIWIGLDDLSVAEAENWVGWPIAATWVPQERAAGSPATIRSKALEHLVGQYECVVLTDADDVLGECRVETARRALEDCDVVGCALRLIDHRGQDLERIFRPDPSVALEELLAKHNVFGLSNTAYRTETLGHCLPIPRDCNLIDWYLVTRAWYSDARLGFDYAPHMYYRRHGNNTAGVLAPFSEAQILRATRLVLAHYEFVLDVPAVSRAKPESVDAARKRAKLFHQVITTSPERLAEYKRALNALEPNYIWWWSVANPELEDLWKR